jgi:hypothetical protein
MLSWKKLQLGNSAKNATIKMSTGNPVSSEAADYGGRCHQDGTLALLRCLRGQLAVPGAWGRFHSHQIRLIIKSSKKNVVLFALADNGNYVSKPARVVVFWLIFLSPIPSRFNHSIKDWQCRQMWLFVLCQEHSTDINYLCCLYWHPVKTNKVVDRLSHGSGSHTG